VGLVNLEDAPAFLTFEEMQRALGRVTYKPGFDLSLFMHPYEGPNLRIKTTVPDGSDPTKTVDLYINSLIPEWLIETEDHFYRYVLWRLHKVEAHETCEFLHVDGKPYRDPHDFIEPSKGMS
jgi:hypothetical protein